MDPRRTGQSVQRIVGALVAALIGAGLALAAAQLPSGELRPFGSLTVDLAALEWLALVGVPVVAWLGWHLAPGVVTRSPRKALTQAVWLAVLAVIVGSVAATVVGFLAELPGSNADWQALVLLPYLLAVPIVGIILFGLPALAVTLPAALLWMAILQVLAPRLAPLPPPPDPVAP